MKLKLHITLTSGKPDEFFDADSPKVVELANGALRVDWTYQKAEQTARLNKTYAAGSWRTHETLPE